MGWATGEPMTSPWVQAQVLFTSRGSGSEIKSLKSLNSNEYKRQKLIKHQLFTTDVDIKSWLKVLYEQCFFYVTMMICFARF